MRESLWTGLRTLRQDGSKETYLSISLGKAGELIDNARPNTTAIVSIVDDETIEIKIINDEKPDAESTDEPEP